MLSAARPARITLSVVTASYSPLFTPSAHLRKLSVAVTIAAGCADWSCVSDVVPFWVHTRRLARSFTLLMAVLPAFTRMSWPALKYGPTKPTIFARSGVIV